MLHGEAKLGVNSQGGPRGVTKFESQNWLMPMAFRRVGRGTLQLRGMFSAEPLTFSGAGSPQLFQAGEAYKGRALVTLSTRTTCLWSCRRRTLCPSASAAHGTRTWVSPASPRSAPSLSCPRVGVGEPDGPARTPPARLTHISYGIFTTGFTYRWLKLEGSVFNGREPDERRYNLEFNPWNSRSFRVTVAPSANWAVQYSYGFLKNPEHSSPATCEGRRPPCSTTGRSRAATSRRR